MFEFNRQRGWYVKTYKSLILASSGALALAGCGPSDIASPGTGGNVTINNNTTPPTTTPTGSAGTVTAASGCPTIADPQGLTDSGTITGPTGVWRVCTLPNTINASITLPKIAGLLYALNGRTNVGTDRGFTKVAGEQSVTLTIDPGVILYGNTGTSWLAVNRGNKINAVGTATAPIIFTSRDNVLGLNTETSQGQWGGVVLMGRAKITDCDSTGGGTVVGGTCQRNTEGSADPALYGGQDDADSSGTMKYVQIRYSGYVLGADKELQALTTEGVGSGTVLDFIQSYNSSDDGAELFGGVVNMKHYVAVGADDDSLDIDTGLRGNLQYLLLIQRAGAGDALMEIDSNGASTETVSGTTSAVFRHNTKISNFTAIQPSASSNNEANDRASILIRGNADITLANGIVYTPNNECIRMDDSGIVAPGTAATLTARAVAMTCNSDKYIGSTNFTATSVGSAFGSGANGNNDSLTSTLTGGFINGTNEAAIVAFDASTLSIFFTATTYIGAVQNSADTWYAGWTCNSGAANLGTGNTSCISLPTT